jgi:hypothetical protein
MDALVSFPGPLGTESVELFETKARTLLAQADAHRDLSTGLAHDDAS